MTKFRVYLAHDKEEEVISMQWELLGFKDDPFKTHPITSYTLALYTGNEEKIKQAKFALNTSNIVMVVEGERGVGTTSFGNFMRFTAHNEKKYFTPSSEVKVEPHWRADTLIAAVIGNIVTSLELSHHDEIKKNKDFIEAKAIVSRITETFKSFGLQGLGIGGNYGESGVTTQPMMMPTQMLAHYLEKLVAVVKKLGFKYGVLIQLNNLDVGTVQDEKHFTVLLNVMRDYFQMPGTSWMLVGDTELRRFIAQKVDRVDDIVGCEIEITPLSETAYWQLIQKRIQYFRINPQIELPIEKTVWLYLFKVTQGRLRYIFGLLNRLYSVLQLGVLTDYMSLDMAKPAIKSFGLQRIQRHQLSVAELLTLKTVVANKNIQVGDLAKVVGKSQTQVSKMLRCLHELRLVSYKQVWRSRHYTASIDAQLAYS
jgi:hypothetical protein